jgi:NAD(P)-dependent dehydrogenase (short-subunit alcohol dehydrogenase family)
MTQQPIGSGFGPYTTASEALGSTNLEGKIALVTGGYSGLGLETARVLASAGATVIAPARSPEKARAALAAVPNAELECLDLLDPTSIDALADRFLKSGRPLHILINSAGVMATPLLRDRRGNEVQLSTNHLGHFQLTHRLWPALCRAEGARVISLSSRAHRLGGVDFDDPNFEHREYQKWIAYAQSKTANALFAVGLDQRGKNDGVRAFSVHPGTVLSDLARSLSQNEIAAFNVYDADGSVRIDPENDLKTVSQGAATAVWCATSHQLADVGGVYCEDCDVAELAAVDSDRRSGVRPWATDPGLADKLWKLSNDLLGL